jgi:uncharacterized membrane protein
MGCNLNNCNIAAHFGTDDGIVNGMKAKVALLALLSYISATLVTSPVFAVVEQGADSARGSGQPAMLFGDGGIFSTITNVLLFIIGAVAVIMIVIGGLRYVLSGGDSKQVEAAKNTIMYAIVGIIVALLAYAAVNFVTTTFTNTTGVTSGGQSQSAGTSTR